MSHLRRPLGYMALLLAAVFLWTPVGFWYCKSAPSPFLFIMGIAFGIAAIVLLAERS